MLQKIREKSQGVFAWVILILICVPFALWGIQNYLGVGQETPVVSVGDKEFFQRDVNKAYIQHSQNLAGRGLDEETLKTQALSKLIRDEVLLQYVKAEKLQVTDETVRDFIKSLQYFQVDGKFDKKQYQALLASQNMSSAEFQGNIRNALIMQQFQSSVTDSSFVTDYELDNFYRIQNQQRNFEYVMLAPPKLAEKPSEEEIKEYYQQHQQKYQSPERMAIEYIELSLDKLAADVEVTDEQLQKLYEEQKDVYTVKERRKISHILFSTADIDEEEALKKAKQARERAKTEDFAALAAELSDDKLTAKHGGDLGLFNVGEMEKAFEDAASSLQLGEISEPVKSAFGYHLIKVTELEPAKIKPFDEAREEVKKDYQKTQAENNFYELSEILTEVSFENPDNLGAAADAIGVTTKKTTLFTRDSQEGIAAEQAVRDMAFSEEVLQGNNSEPIELGSDRLIVLRMLEYQPAATKKLKEVRAQVEQDLLADKASKQVTELAEQLKQALQKGETLQALAEKNKLEVKKVTGLTRNKGELPWQLIRSVFSAAKPTEGNPIILTVNLPAGNVAVVSLEKVIEGKVTAEDKDKQKALAQNIARVYGQTEFNSVIGNLESATEIVNYSEN
jgi:peptidyl-prolyl cis-trans isomerase D